MRHDQHATILVVPLSACICTYDLDARTCYTHGFFQASKCTGTWTFCILLLNLVSKYRKFLHKNKWPPPPANSWGSKHSCIIKSPVFSRFQGCSGPVPLRFWGPENTKSAQLPDPEIALRISHRSSGSHVGIRGAVGHINQIGSTKRRPVRIKNASPQRREADHDIP